MKTDDLDKLLEIASQPTIKKVKEPKTNPEIDSFISELNITSGKKRISTSLIYYHYFIWKKIRLISRRKFIKYFSTKFEKVNTNDGIAFLLNPKPFDLTPQNYFRARAYFRKEKDEKKVKT